METLQEHRSWPLTSFFQRWSLPHPLPSPRIIVDRVVLTCRTGGVMTEWESPCLGIVVLPWSPPDLASPASTVEPGLTGVLSRSWTVQHLRQQPARVSAKSMEGQSGPLTGSTWCSNREREREWGLLVFTDELRVEMENIKFRPKRLQPNWGWINEVGMQWKPWNKR